jgi:tetratricopeptide (TPR) repeat protein
MRFSKNACLAGVWMAASLVMAQQPPPKGPHPKNKEELAALQKVQAAAQTGNPDTELAAINNVLENFVDTQYKPMLISMGLQAAQQKDDLPLIETWVQRAETDNPNDIEAHVVEAEAVARHTRENDLDKDKSLATIDSNANKALELLKSADQPPLGVQDAQWPALKAQLTSEAYEALGIGAGLAKKYPDSVTDYKSAVAAAGADPSAAVLKARLAKAYVDNKQFDDAISTANEVLANASAQPVVKQFAQSQKDAATKMKGAK